MLLHFFKIIPACQSSAFPGMSCQLSTSSCCMHNLVNRPQWIISVPAGDLSKEEAVLKWVTAEETLQIPNQIEEVNQRMLERILNISDNVAVFFCEFVLPYSGKRKKNTLICLSAWMSSSLD